MDSSLCKKRLNTVNLVILPTFCFCSRLEILLRMMDELMQKRYVCDIVHVFSCRGSRVRGKKKQWPLHRHCQVTKDLLYFSSMFSHIHIGHGFSIWCLLSYSSSYSAWFVFYSKLTTRFSAQNLNTDFSFNYPTHDITVIPSYHPLWCWHLRLKIYIFGYSLKGARSRNWVLILSEEEPSSGNFIIFLLSKAPMWEFINILRI